MPNKDVFICHASEDKQQYVEPLKELLEANGISTWYDDNEILVGEDLTEAIERGLNNSHYCLVVMSSHFLTKDWANRELAMIHERERTKGRFVLLPLVEDKSEKKIKETNPFLVNRRFLKWSEKEKLVSQVQKYLAGKDSPVEAWNLGDYLYQLETLYPVLHWIGRSVPPKETKAYFTALQSLFYGRNIFLSGVDESLNFALDLVLRVLSTDPEINNHYGAGKLESSLRQLVPFFKSHKDIDANGLLLGEAIIVIENFLEGDYYLEIINRSALIIYLLLLRYLKRYRHKDGYHQLSIEMSNQLHALLSESMPIEAPVQLPKLHDEWGWESIYTHTEKGWLSEVKDSSC